MIIIINGFNYFLKLLIAYFGYDDGGYSYWFDVF